MLLTHPNVDPAADKSCTLTSACIYGHYDVVIMLLNDRRVNPADDNNLLIKTVCSRIENNPLLLKLLELLLGNESIDISIENNKIMRFVFSEGH